MMSERVQRRDARVKVAWPVVCEKTRQVEQQLHPSLQAVYERVQADAADVGKRFTATVRDVSVNGAFIEGTPLPILSRVAMSIDVPEFRRVEAIGWVLWRRSAACAFESDGRTVELSPGFGVVFEWIPLEARLELARRVAQGG